jgi:hypothetical protein
VTAAKNILWLPIVLVAGFELYAASLVLRPSVDATYRAYFIDKTSDCWPHVTPASYELGKDLSFTEGAPNLFFPNKGCGWFYPNAKGTWSYGPFSTMLFRFPGEDLPLTLTINAGAMVDAAHPNQRVEVSANGTKLGTLSFGSMEPEVRTVSIPAELGKTGSLDLRFDFPDARSGKELGPNEDAHLRAIRFVSMKIDKS